jgi:hypothetical protein
LLWGCLHGGSKGGGKEGLKGVSMKGFKKTMVKSKREKEKRV